MLPKLFAAGLLPAVLLAAVGAAQPPNPSSGELIAWWPSPDAATFRLLREIGADAVITPLTANLPRGEERALRVIAELPAGTSLHQLPGLLRQARAGGFDAAAVPATGDAPSFRHLIETERGFVRYAYLKPEQLDWDVTPAQAVLQAGIWPGLHHLDTSKAGASERPWLDANLNLYAYLHSFYPHRLPMLSYRPEKPSSQYETVEIALAEAYAGGGNVVLFVPEPYREALRRSNPRAVAAWKSLALTAAFLKHHATLTRRANGARVGVLSSSLEQAEELLNLAYRDNLAPTVLPVNRLPQLAASQYRVIVAANLPISVDAAQRLLRFAADGGNVITAPPPERKPAGWWSAAGARKVRGEPGYDVYAIGKGKVYAYHEAVLDPAEFALDVREVAGLDNPQGAGLHGLDFRLWNTGTILGALHRDSGETVLILTSYGSHRDYDLLVGVRGQFQSATFEDVRGGGPQPLPLMLREGRVELDLKGFRRTAIIVLREKKG